MRAAIYIRYSSELQDRDSSLLRQRTVCAEWAAAHGYEVVREYADEAQSGTTALRPGWQALLAVTGFAPRLILWMCV